MDQNFILSLILLLVSLFVFRVALKYYNLNKINYINSKMTLRTLGKYDRKFDVYMKSEYKNHNIEIELILFELLNSIKKSKLKIGSFFEKNKSGTVLI